MATLTRQFAPPRTTLKRDPVGEGKLIARQAFPSLPDIRAPVTVPIRQPHSSRPRQLAGNLSRCVRAVDSLCRRRVVSKQPGTGESVRSGCAEAYQLSSAIDQPLRLYLVPTTGDENQVVSRIDYVRGEKHTLFGRYFITGYGNPANGMRHDILVTSRQRDTRNRRHLDAISSTRRSRAAATTIVDAVNANTLGAKHVYERARRSAHHVWRVVVRGRLRHLFSQESLQRQHISGGRRRGKDPRASAKVGVDAIRTQMTYSQGICRTATSASRSRLRAMPSSITCWAA